MVGWLGVLALVGAAPGCGARTFSCTDDAGCGGDGRCESDGWCSFPDAACATGRRYAEFSGDGVAGTCVDALPQASSTGSPSGGEVDTSGTTDPSSSGADPTGGPLTTPVESGGSSVGTGGDSSTTCFDGECGTSMSTGPMMSTGSAESSSEDTGKPVPPCPGFFDDFDDGEFDPVWEVYGGTGPGGHTMAEEGSELRWDFVPGLIQQRGLTRTFDTSVLAVVVHTTETTMLPGAQAQTVLLFRETGVDADVHVVWSNDMLQVRNGGAPVADSPVFEWVELRFDAGELLVSTSTNGVDFDLLATLDEGHGAGGLQQVWLYGQTWTEAPGAASAAFDSIRVCEP